MITSNNMWPPSAISKFDWSLLHLRMTFFMRHRCLREYWLLIGNTISVKMDVFDREDCEIDSLFKKYSQHGKMSMLGLKCALLHCSGEKMKNVSSHMAARAQYSTCIGSLITDDIPAVRCSRCCHRSRLPCERGIFVAGVQIDFDKISWISRISAAAATGIH